MSDGVHEELALFELPPQDAAVESEETIEYRPVGQDATNSSSVEFLIPANNVFFVDLKSSALETKLKIIKADGTTVTEENPVTFANMPLHTIWNQVDVTLGQQLVSQGVNNNYPYKAYLDTLLSHKSSLGPLSAQGFYDDTAGGMDMNDPTNYDGTINNGLINRFNLTKLGRGVQFEGPLYSDMWKQGRYLPNGLDIGVKLWHSQDKFRLVAPSKPPGCKVVVEDVVLKVRMVKLKPKALIGLNEMAEKLELAEKTRSNLLADVAHELRTPLTVIQGNLRAILDDV